ncbi:hypothetical protein CI109_105172 [Kwoniella shandongensis]|uniref:Uncharacterized protein n=1 Tax=Kwoniella shandongensis TaxID=1734106 RepID=A0A5M6C386_9TREE|nr:uncharacterized protein CI109_002011 [Kwoniella shandongensis]KAA5529586.1 hypothetical protein CI109_002011 [Kwoniella shandongensis]
MDEVQRTRTQINDLVTSIRDFITTSSDSATYQSPIIDWHHPDAYRQPSIAGLRKFLSTVDNERQYIEQLVSSSAPPKELNTNAPHLLAVWEEAQQADWPLICISQVLECGDEGQVKVDVVARGGEEWIKVNTMKESRLMAEFREQDSYINSDYDTDSDLDDPSDHAGPSRPPSLPSLTNSAIEQAASLVRAAEAYPRLAGLPPPRIKYVLNRLEEFPEGGYNDSRIKHTFEAIRALGVELVLAGAARPQPRRYSLPSPRPTRDILLDLSVVVALCCDSTHQPLPTSSEELEARFRPLQLSTDGDQLELAPHSNVTKDLRDQLDWEMQHPLVQEMQERLATIDGPIEFWVTEEVQGRLPKIAEIIGGEGEKRRARALFTGEEDFWQGSRWKGKEGILGGMRVNVLDESKANQRALDAIEQSPFRKGFVQVCHTMLDIVEQQEAAASSTASLPPLAKTANPTWKKKGSRKPSRRAPVGISLASKLPSAHTLRTFLAGLKSGMTVLTNNRGAVGKVIREIRVGEGLNYGDEELAWMSREGGVDAAVWVVNPSSLAEWRRREVEEKNTEVLEQWEIMKGGG